MRRVVVRYTVKAERVEEHEDLVRKVFAELASARPAGLAYQALKLDDGVSFVHTATISSADGTNPLTALATFKAFAAGIADRCVAPPINSPATALGVYSSASAEGGVEW